jgi:hypothetical protein
MRVVYSGLMSALLVFLPVAVMAQDEPATELEIPGLIEDEVELTPQQEYDRLLRQVDGLIVYNALLETQIANQDREVQSIQTAMGMIPEIERQVPALLTRMVDSLQQFVALDVPFYAEERAERVNDLQLLIERADVGVSDKFRRVLEAWQIENEYGRSVSAYEGQLEINGTTREVFFLQLGRVALVYQTPDLEHTGAWDQETRSWQPLGNRYRNSVRQALRMARQQIAPDIVLVPLPSPEG